MNEQCVIKTRETNKEDFVVVYDGKYGIYAEGLYAYHKCRLSMQQAGMVLLIRDGYK